MNYRQSHLNTAGAQYDEDLSAGNFDEYMGIHEKKILIQILAHGIVPSLQKYLDFACGTGRIVETVAPYFAQTLAIDVSDKMMQVAQQKVPEVEFLKIDITNEAGVTDKYDLITAFRFFGNAENTLRKDVLKALYPRLKASGVLIVNNHRNCQSFRSLLSQDKKGMDLTNTHFIKLLNDSGFSVQQKIPIGVWMLRHQWFEKKIWSTRLAKLAESMTRIAMLTKFAPDAIFVCRKLCLSPKAQG